MWIPGKRWIPLFKLLAIGEVALLTRNHLRKLTPDERRRFVALMREGRGRPSNLSVTERDELTKLIARAEPRLFAGTVVQKLSPMPLPRRLLYGPRRKQKVH